MILLAATAVLTLGAIVATHWWAIVPWWSSPLWVILALLAARAHRRGEPQGLRAMTTLAWAYGLTLFGVWLVAFPQNVPTGPRMEHAAYGQHPVFACAGLPWPGVEGSRYALAHDRIPFFMGVDALLVNFASWAGLLFCLRRRKERTLEPEQVWIACGAALAGCATGGWRLVEYFD